MFLSASRYFGVARNTPFTVTGWWGEGVNTRRPGAVNPAAYRRVSITTCSNLRKARGSRPFHCGVYACTCMYIRHPHPFFPPKKPLLTGRIVYLSGGRGRVHVATCINFHGLLKVRLIYIYIYKHI